MKKLSALSLVALLATASTFANATANNTYTAKGSLIESISSYSKEESIFPAWRSMTQLTFSGELVWTSGGCHNKHVAVRDSDQNLIRLAELAFINNRQIRVYADATVPKLDNQYCVLRAVTII
ncbi:hypothetical protein [Pseudoalteromonas sp. Of7M-16]|uniref:hypothetical protein n=1 Tax=Pseudoalteromonas sp. Of7M-16 TaxID=2917756 RepID=UPI001EF512D8|nr:hypothetical protein [Pseudoalteromonas sp. Of7M-16]MCG7550469.1 hypothetical protein [Pseudoalteromonas sp. Of7M-16]